MSRFNQDNGGHHHYPPVSTLSPKAHGPFICPPPPAQQQYPQCSRVASEGLECDLDTSSIPAPSWRRCGFCTSWEPPSSELPSLSSLTLCSAITVTSGSSQPPPHHPTHRRSVCLGVGGLYIDSIYMCVPPLDLLVAVLRSPGLLQRWHLCVPTSCPFSGPPSRLCFSSPRACFYVEL